MSNSSHPSLATCTFMMTRYIVVGTLFSKTIFFLTYCVYFFLALVLYDEAGRAVTIDEKIFPKIKVQYSYIHLLLLLIYMSNQVIIQH